ncbi:hypothetical protein GQ42DRAFT_162066 [Ramicandelaber brevisporus]|nr:hypothetical protein GQ42DRAFT_162066 [Ramicandelaber brevisporus]
MGIRRQKGSDLSTSAKRRKGEQLETIAKAEAGTEADAVATTPSTTESDDNTQEKPGFYTDAINYWETVPATVDGMLGGLETVNAADVRGSLSFLAELRTLHPPAKRQGTQSTASADSSQKQYPWRRACDCGAGIGRVTKNMLLKSFEHVDLVEQNAAFLEEAKSSFLKNEIADGRVTVLPACGLQDFAPQPATLDDDNSGYDVIWCQWVLSHLTDEHLVNFFERCKAALRPENKGRWIIVKENIAAVEDQFDEQDSSVTRTDASLRAIFDKAGLKVVKTKTQTGFPHGLFKVNMYALSCNE